MKFCKIFSNYNDRFHNIEFNNELNVILAEITDKSKTDRDTHNLGKTLLISVIDFLLLKGINKKSKFYLTKGGFEGQTFYAEIQLNNGKFLIVRRGVDSPTKISFKLNKNKLQRFTTKLDWDLVDLPLSKAKKELNNYLGFDVLKSWPYRKSLTYFLRTQNDFRDVFKLDKFKGRDKDWKPFMFDLLGFDGTAILQKYELEDEKKDLEKKVATLQQEADVNIEEKDKVQGLLDIKTDEKRKVEERIDKFNFYEKDKAINEELIEGIDNRIQALNTSRYSISIEVSKIENSLSTNIESLDLDKLKALYEDVGIYFPNQLTNDYEMLLDFNRTITEERNKVLKENQKSSKIELKNVNNELKSFEAEKEKLLSFLTEKDSYFKFKEIQKQLAKIEADIIRLHEKLQIIDRTRILAKGIETKETEISDETNQIQTLIGEQKHSKIRKIFNSIIKEILNTNALISIKQNKQGNVEFEANIQNPKDLTITEEDYGNTYRKLLCMAFDLSILIFYAKNSFYHFVYHDGALEALDDRKKIKFINLVSA